jgi:hypothetical protein
LLPGFLSRGPTVRDADVAAFEARCGLSLPADYRQFLLDQNGGDRAPAERPEEEIEETGERSHRFFSLGLADLSDPEEIDSLSGEDAQEWPELLHDLEVRARWWRGSGLPAHWLPIADVCNGELLLLRVKGRGVGSVHFSYDPRGYDEGHLEKVAKSFTELLRDFEDWGYA